MSEVQKHVLCFRKIYIHYAFFLKFWYSKFCLVENSWCQRTKWFRTLLYVDFPSKVLIWILSSGPETFFLSVFSFFLMLSSEDTVSTQGVEHALGQLTYSTTWHHLKAGACLLTTIYCVGHGSNLGRAASGRMGFMRILVERQNSCPRCHRIAIAMLIRELREGCTAKPLYLDYVARAQ